MCGFFCYLEIPSTNSDSLYKKSCENIYLLNNRGPDSSSKNFIEKENYNLFMAHSRLAIQDKSEIYKQPYFNPKSENTLIYNGEIYDYGKYNSEFEKSSSDTFALSHLLEMDNFDLSELDGMYSFVHWNKYSEKLTIARDRFGIKPLFIFRNSNLISLSSSLRLLSRVFNLKKINDENLKELIFLGHSLDYGTIYKNINEFPINQISTFSALDFSIKHKAIFNSEIFSRKKSRGNKFDKLNLEKKISKSIKRQLSHSDRGSGIFLSGGVDSSVLAGAAKKFELLNPIENTFFSLSLKNSEHDESSRISQFKQLFDPNYIFNYRNIPFQEDNILELLEDYLSLDYPILDLGIFPMMHLCKNIDKNTRVVLSGDGADELFGGYERDRIALKRFKIKKYIPNLIKNFLYKNLPKKYSKYLKNENILELRFRLMGAEIITNKLKMGKFTFDKNNFLNLLKFEQQVYLRSVLAKVDAASMRYSLEVRVPYLSKLITDYLSNKNSIDFLKKPIKYELKELLSSYSSKSFSYLNKKGFNIGSNDNLKLINKKLDSVKNLFLEDQFMEIIFSSDALISRLKLISFWVNGK